VPLAAVGQVTVGLFATAICKRVVALNRVVAVVSVDSFETTTCRLLAAPVQTEPTQAAARANVGSFKIQTSKLIAGLQRAEVAANVALSATTIYKPCAAPKQVAAAGNAALFATTTCRQRAGRKPVDQSFT
jgi:hypothetical protein